MLTVPVAAVAAMFHRSSGSIRTMFDTVPPLTTGEVRVLLVSVSVVARPTSVSVLVGSVSVPVLTMVPMIGEVSVLLVSVCVFVVPTTAPVAPCPVVAWM